MRYDIWDTLQGIHISHLGKMKIIFKYAILGGYVSSQEGIPSGDFPRSPRRSGTSTFVL